MVVAVAGSADHAFPRKLLRSWRTAMYWWETTLGSMNVKLANVLASPSLSGRLWMEAWEPHETPWRIPFSQLLTLLHMHMCMDMYIRPPPLTTVTKAGMLVFHVCVELSKVWKSDLSETADAKDTNWCQIDRKKERNREREKEKRKHLFWGSATISSAEQMM